MSPEPDRGPRTSVAAAALAVAAVLAAAMLVVFLALPLVGVLARVSPAGVLARLGSPEVRAALRVSAVTAVAAVAVVVIAGTPLAWLLATRRFPGKRCVEVLVDLPMVLPPTVAGFALLMAFGRAGLAGRALGVLGVSLPFTTLGVVVAQAFMAAPFYVGAARAGFTAVDSRLLDAAAVLRASEPFTFFRVVAPLAAPSLVAGTAMSAARALGEFGATITFAGNLPGVSQTLPLAVYVALQSDLDTAVVLTVVLLAASVALLLALRAAPEALPWGRPHVVRPSAGAAR